MSDEQRCIQEGVTEPPPQQTTSKIEEEGCVTTNGNGTTHTDTEEIAGISGDKSKLPRPTGVEPCPRCQSKDTKFCYYNNYNIKQPRYYCKACQRYWTAGGTLRDVPVGSGRRRNVRPGTKSQEDALSAAPLPLGLLPIDPTLAAISLSAVGTPSVAPILPALLPTTTTGIVAPLGPLTAGAMPLGSDSLTKATATALLPEPTAYMQRAIRQESIKGEYSDDGAVEGRRTRRRKVQEGTSKLTQSSGTPQVPYPLPLDWGAASHYAALAQAHLAGPVLPPRPFGVPPVAIPQLVGAPSPGFWPGYGLPYGAFPPATYSVPGLYPVPPVTIDIVTKGPNNNNNDTATTVTTTAHNGERERKDSMANGEGLHVTNTIPSLVPGLLGGIPGWTGPIPWAGIPPIGYIAPSFTGPVVPKTTPQQPIQDEPSKTNNEPSMTKHDNHSGDK